MNARNPASILVMALAAFAARSSFVEARNTYIDTIELMTADSDLVVLGDITGVTSVPGGSEYSLQVTIRVKETLKRPGTFKIPDDEDITAFFVSSPHEMVAWRDRKSELLVFLTFGASVESTGERRWGPRGGRSFIAIDECAQPVVTMDFDVLTTREEIVRAARAGCSAPVSDGSRRRHRINDGPPRSSPLGRLIWSSVVIVSVPTDARLERRAWAWAASESLEYRYLAPWALSPFPSKDNVAILLQLLADDLHTDSPDGHGGVTIRYPVRRPAYDVLRRWGVETKEPIEEVHVGADVWTPKDDPRAEPEPAK